jgi:hypothetical protein
VLDVPTVTAADIDPPRSSFDFSFHKLLSGWPNKSPEPTAVGACRSAIAVHVAGRRWLSFLR